MSIRPLSKGQANVLAALRSLPARYRHQGRPGAPVKLQYAEVYYWNTIRSLINRGLLRLTEYGIETEV